MSSPIGVLKIRGDRDAGISTLEKLQALVASREAAARPWDQDPTPPSSHQCGSTTTPRKQHSDNEGVPMKTVQIRVDAAQTTCVTGDLWANVDMFAWQPSQVPKIPGKAIKHHRKIYPMPDQSNTSPRSSSLSGKTSSVKRSKSSSMPALSGRSTTSSG
jgi:hypothetical protein